MHKPEGKVFWIPGNHDNLDAMSTVFNAIPQFKRVDCLDLPHWRLIFLDSNENGATEGYLSPHELEKLCFHSQAEPVVGIKHEDSFHITQVTLVLARSKLQEIPSKHLGCPQVLFEQRNQMMISFVACAH